ncbi:glycine--tRNA ligase subunit beta [Rhizorhabdus dicambivorans]|uniref:Glycine--tRNA ligase beta subunit n=1 Tax=Rhizorhabdus dicambivorans TaxID=1850238 RepID=A0A2A4G265_9SPHN|nr:glycine--tRNA ligase subunit beta [Rhizorhabdus dicambivorans]ATE64848.1 glycine--tRNA ligase subunit beta [Rhizorhabdus dicambivorans]PCE44122.1 glycine--tRNA ligase subunit beta [Rhizorhabdus dicambivorans]
MTDFLLELLSEEIPARMQEKASADLAKLFTEELAKAGLKPDGITSYVTPRRLALIAHGLPLATAAVSEETKGPKVGAPPQALEGFLRKTGLTQDQLVERDGVLFAIVEKPGRETAAVLAEAVPAIVRAFPWPKSMRWGSGSLRWVRPLQGIVALLGEDIVPIEVDGVTSGAATIGHRFHHPGIITIGSASDYVEKLRACHVIVDHAERRDIIRVRSAELAAEAGLSVIPDEGLVAENAGLTEWPVPLLGHFDPAFLEVPREVIQLTLRTNQKYFVLNDAAGKLAPAFICTANITAKDGGTAIVAGNGKVLAARLSDAKFFWEQDLKVKLEDYLPKLEAMLFYEGMGSLRAKADRVADLSAWIARAYFPERDPDTARRAGLLAKADLATAMVGEFPELQGIMGGYYAEKAGEKPGTVSALQQQYVAAVEGCIPACVALADRVDTLVAFFARGIKPTGSKDPFALRRAALQVIQTILVNGTRLKLGAVIDQAKAGLGADLDTIELLDFFADRLKVQQREAGVRHDLIDAVFALGGEDDLVRLLARVKALQVFVETEDGANLLAGYKRAANILKKEGGVPEGASAVPDYQPEAAESALITALDSAEPKAANAVQNEDFAAAMSALASLRGPIDAFFDQVTVNDPSPQKRNTRLALLEKIRVAVHNVADFSNIEG